MNPIIEEKDLMLSFVCEHGSYAGVAGFTYTEYPVKGKEKVIGIMKHFQRLNLISECSANAYKVSFLLHLEASELLSKGGFKAQEELLQANIEKLLLEIEDLKPSLPHKVETITNIAANIATAVGLFFGK